MTEIVGIKFKTSGKNYYFSPEGLQLKEGDKVTIVEGVLPSNYYYTIHPSLAMSGNYPFNQRLLSREGRVEAVEENERGFYVKVIFDEE